MIVNIPNGGNVIDQDSWETSLVVFDARIACLPCEESSQLRFCRQIVAEAWLDIKIRLPRPSPSKVAELITSFDGREEGSEYPNFMLASERYSYGL